MVKNLFVFIALSLSLLISACNGENDGKSVSVPMRAKMMASPVAPSAAPSGAAFDAAEMAQTNSAPAETKRRIAQTHDLTIQVDNDLGKRHQEDVESCYKLGCEIINSSVSESNGSLNLRILPEKLDEFLKFLSRNGAEVSDHSISADDKTLEYIDVESRLKSHEALKERLLKLLTETNSTDVKALLEIEKEISRVQGEIDSAKGRIAYLSKLTDMVTVQVYYRRDYERTDLTYSELKNSFRNAWQSFISNVADVIVFIGGALPWIPVILGIIWGFIKTVKFIRRKKAER